MTTQPSLLPDLPDKEVHDFSHTQAHREFELILGELDVVWASWFAQLMREGFTWREAAVCAWMIPDKPDRVPKTQKELATMLGCDVQTVTRHKQKPHVQTKVTQLKVMRFALHVDEIIDASIATAKMPGGRQTAERKMILEELGILTKDKTLHLTVDQPGQRDAASVRDDELLQLSGLDMADIVDGEVVADE